MSDALHSLEDRRILITGGGSGLGRATADAVAAAGGLPIVLDRELSSAGQYRGYRVDVTDRPALEQAVGQAAEAVGGLDAVVTAAGLDRPGELRELSAETWERVVAVNLIGTVSTVRAALPYLLASHGRVVTIASTLALRGAAGATAYCASKFGVRGFSHALAAELAGRAGVTTVIPGGMKTAFFAGRTEQYLPQDDSRLNDPARVADVIVHALSQPAGVEVREVLIANELEDSWP